MRFSYKSGQRVLDGFTIKRGVGKGGFGEVYFAVSDGGKEVALKLLSEREIEMRGVVNCLNLKHPNLVHVYDVRTDEQGETWIVMEYVLGESLAQVVNRHRNGLPEHLAKEWFLSLSRAVGHLHDQGVVHRDLKPANIFIENGNLKVGDYGLCKSLSSGQRQTQRVGTVHYMAPEIGSGKYDKSIDLYACGVMLYEMLTGQVPFDGESDNEILMKHLTAEADLMKLPQAFRPVILKALDKNPLKRYGTMSEFARAVDAATLPIAQPASAPVHAAQGHAIPAPTLAAPSQPLFAPPVVTAMPLIDGTPIMLGDPPRALTLPQAVALPNPLPHVNQQTPLPQARPVITAWRDRITDLAGGLTKAPLIGALALVPYALLAQTSEWATLGKMFLMTSTLSWVLLIGAGRRNYRSTDSWWPRLRFAMLGMAVGVLAFWAEGWAMPLVNTWPTPTGYKTLFGLLTFEGDTLSVLSRYMLYFGGILGAGRWWRTVARDRKDRLTLWPPIAAGLWGSLLLFLWPWESGSPVTGAIVPLILATVAVQMVSPWTPPPPPQPKKLRFRG